MEHSPKIEYYKKRQFSDKLNITFVYMRENAWPFLKVQLMIAGPILLLLNIATGQLSMSFLSFGSQPMDSDFLAEMMKLYGIALMGGLITGSIIPALAYGYMEAYKTKAPAEITVAQVTKGFGLRFISLLGYGIFAGIVMMIGTFFFIIPGIYLMIVLSLGGSIIVFEKADPFAAFGRCFKLIKDKWFSTAGLVLVVGIIAYFVNMLFSLPQAIVMGAWLFTNLESGPPDFSEMPLYLQALNVFFAALQSFAGIISYSVIYIALAFQYFNLVERIESRGLMAKINAMDEAPAEDEGETY